MSREPGVPDAPNQLNPFQDLRGRSFYVRAFDHEGRHNVNFIETTFLSQTER